MREIPIFTIGTPWLYSDEYTHKPEDLDQLI